jgi:hypothetical protein
LAIAADAELRRRHSDRKIEPLRSAEPAPVRDDERQHPDLIPQHRTGKAIRIPDFEAQRHAFRTAMSDFRKLAPRQQAAQGGLDAAFPDLRPPWPEPILQPPTPQIASSAEILQLAAEYDIEPEAAD